MCLLKKQWFELNFTFNQNENTSKALSYPSVLLKGPRALPFKKIVGKTESKYCITHSFLFK